MEFSIDRDTQLCVSLSARPGNFGTRFQNYLFRKFALNMIYKAFRTDDIAGALAGVRALGIRGAAISMPFKEKALDFLDARDESVEKVRSVNTIVNEGDGYLKGYNTDYSAVRHLLSTNPISKFAPVVVRGSGGMAKAVVWAFRDEGFENLRVVSRNETTGRLIAEATGYAWERDFPTGTVRDATLVNTTPIGMGSGPEVGHTPFDEHEIRAAEWVFDVIAVPIETPLVKLARAAGKKILNGGDLLAPQAAEQFFLYTGLRPSENLVGEAAHFARSNP